jgi:two-component sensor histidine kinase
LVFRECGHAQAETDAIMKNVNDQNCSFFNPPFSQPVMSHSCRPVPLYQFVVLLLIGFTTQAGANAPFSRSEVNLTYADSLKGLLRQHSPDTNQVKQLILLSEYYLSRHKEIGDKKYLEDTYRYYRQAAGLSNTLGFVSGQIRCQYLLSSIISRQGGPDQEIKDVIVKGIGLSQKAGDKLQEAEGWHSLAEVYRLTAADLPEKIRCYELAMVGFRQAGNRNKEADMLKMVASMHQLQGKHELAVCEAQQVLEMQRATGNGYLHHIYDLLAEIQGKRGYFREALQFGFDAIQCARATKDTSNLGLYYLRIGSCFKNLKQFKESLQYLRQSLQRSQRAGHTRYAYFAAGQIADILTSQHQEKEALLFMRKVVAETPPVDERSQWVAFKYLALCHLALKRYALTENYYLQMLTLEKSPAIPDMYRSDFYQQLGDFYLATSKYDKAHAYLEKGLALSAQLSLLQRADSHLSLFKADSARNNLREAIAHYQQYKVINDSIFNETKSKQVASLQIEYETKEKEQNIALLTKKNEVQQARMKQKELQQNSVIVVALLLGLLSVVIYNRYRLKRQSNRLLQSQKEEIREKNTVLEWLLSEKEDLITHKDTLLEEKEMLLREIHHRVKNNLQIVMSLLNSQTRYLQDDKALTAIKESHQRVRAISLIHQKLYQAERVALIDMAAYIRELTEHLGDSFDAQDRIRFDLTVAPLELDVALAVPLGLIINEAVTNSIKYAFPGGRAGTVAVTWVAVDGENNLLTITDNGIGVGSDFDPGRSQTMGMSLMKGLSKQIKGTFRLESIGGLTITVLFSSVHSLRAEEVVTRVRSVEQDRLPATVSTG